ncbi:MAG: hypothetical protein ACLPV8_06600 [Steroidobacteraceae bacterium]
MGKSEVGIKFDGSLVKGDGLDILELVVESVRQGEGFERIE